MSRIIVCGLTALALTACKPVAEPAPPAEPAASTAPAIAVPGADATWIALEDRYRMVETAPADPVAAVEWRAVLCDHFSGEFGGDNSERDREVNARMDELRCGDALIDDARALRTSHAGDPDTVAKLDFVLARLAS